MAEHRCGPDEDAEFFEAIAEVWKKSPEAMRKYSISCSDHEKDIMKIDFDKQTALKRMVGNRITLTEFVDPGEVKGDTICCHWEPTTTGGWKCMERWA